MRSPIRYSPNNGALHIGSLKNKLEIYTREKCARLKIGRRTFHFGRWN